jgi:hypothetical protein
MTVAGACAAARRGAFKFVGELPPPQGQSGCLRRSTANRNRLTDASPGGEGLTQMRGRIVRRLCICATMIRIAEQLARAAYRQLPERPRRFTSRSINRL